MILVIGEALIDLIENRYQPGAFTAVVGGANANVALALARRGTKHQFLGRISNDRFGKIIRDRLETNGVHLEHSISADELTTLAVVSLDSNGVPSYSFYVNGTADWGWTREELPTDVDLENMHATAIQFGCLTMAMEPGNKVIEAWAKEHYDQKSVTISHDINMRPALGFDRETERVRVERVRRGHRHRPNRCEVDRRHGSSRLRHSRWRWRLGLSRVERQREAFRRCITQDQRG
jgi:fructokinase